MLTATAPAFTAANVDKFVCPRCHSRLVTLDEEVPWCGNCTWNLDAFPDDPNDSSLRRRISQADRKRAYELGGKLVAELSGTEVTRSSNGRAHHLLMAISLLLLLVVLSLIALGSWLVATGGPTLLAGLVVLALAVALRPRLGTRRRALKNTWTIRREQAPTLFVLIDRVAASIGSPLPHVVAIAPDWQAATTVVGPTRHRVMLIGLPLWTVARPQERVALLGHELGHFVNGDSSRDLLTQPALTTFGRLAALTHLPITAQMNFVVLAAYWLFIFMPARILSFILWSIHLALNALGARESRRAEHYADALAAQAAGTTATQGLLDLLTEGPELQRVIASAARRGDLALVWRTTANAASERWGEKLARRRQLTLRHEATTIASHPADGLRHQLLGSTPFRSPAVVLTDAESQQIDAELARYERACAECIDVLWR